MRAGTAALWSFADAFDLVPAPADGRLTQLLQAWWGSPRVWGCTSAAASPLWLVVLPDPSVWCGLCGMAVFRDERRCTWCHEHLSRRTATGLHYEFGGGVLLGRAHQRCQEEAA